MKLSVEGQLRRAVWGLFAIGAAGTAVNSPAALAQTGGDVTQLKGVEVTGSRIRRVDTESSDLVQTLDRKQIEATGATTLGELIQAVPSVTGAPLTASANNNGGSITGGGGSYGGGGSIDVRGLGPKRTLLLLDGQRLNNNDPDAIPANMIERIEVLKEGAGSTYGTDAIGGVVNFITRKSFSGLEATAQYGKTQRNDGAATGASITWGSSGAKYKAVFGLNYNDQREIRATSRYATKDPAGLAYGAITAGAFSSSRAPGGRFTLPTGSAAATTLGCTSVTLKAGATGTSIGDYRCFVNSFGAGGDRFNYQPYNLDLDPSRRESLFGTGSYKFNDSVTWYGEGFFTHTQSTRKLAPEPFDISTITGIFPTLGAPTISKDSIYNPFGVDITSYAKRSVDAGARQLDYNVDQWQASTGVKGVIFDRFAWDLGYNYGRLDLSNPNRGYLDFSKVFQELGPSFKDASGTPTCGTPSAPILNCTPINIFGTTGSTLAALGTVANDITVQDEQDFTLNVSGDVFDLPAGALQMAVGAEYRSLHIDSIVDGLQSSFQLSEANEKETSGGYNVREAYAEARVPIIKGVPLIKSFDLNLGVRYSDFSSFGSNVAGKYAMEYRPVDDLLLRATYSDTFRAPTTGELFGGATQSAPSYADPCLDPGTPDPTTKKPSATAASIAGHPNACNGVAIGSIQPNTQGNGNTIGNPNLKPEKGYSTDFGLVFNPTFYKPLTITLDYYHYTLKHAISSISIDEVLNACYANDSSPFCAKAPDGTNYFVRVNDAADPAHPTTSIANATLPLLNDFSLYQTGWDGEVKLDYHNVRAGGINFGNFDFGVDLTYIDNFRVKLFDPTSGVLVDDASVAGTYDWADTGVAAPRFKGLGFLFWSLGPVAVSVEDRYVGNIKINGADLGTGAPYNPGYANYVDIAGTYTVKPINTSFTVGINDLFDDGIQRTFDQAGAGAPNPVYDVRGRNFYGKVTVRFK
ncbi:MAG: TonB-dependent receptor [Nevskia sp.]|nr:TonB-dependent receptor [Nevskia sp.]